MDLTDKLRLSALVDLSQVELSNLSRYARKNKPAITALYEHKILDDSMIDNALRAAVLSQAQTDYDYMTSGKVSRELTYPDHLVENSRKSFAYALSIGLFSDKELKRIPFDHGDTPESFVRSYLPKDLFSELRQEYLNPKPEPIYEGNSCEGCCCTECP
jgi:hypothetical protein